MPLVVDPATTPITVAAKVDAGVVRIEIAGAVLHVASDCSPDRAAALAAALKTGSVIFPDQPVQIVIATKPVDFRKGHGVL